MKAKFAAFSFGLMLNLTACSVIRTDPTESINVKTSPPGAVCSLTRDGKVVGEVKSTPADIVVDRNKHDLLVSCKKDGYQEGSTALKARLARTFYSNLTSLDVLGLAVDAGTGADNSYPDAEIELLPSTQSDTPSVDSAAIPESSVGKTP